MSSKTDHDGQSENIEVNFEDPIYLHMVIQGSDEWLKKRLGMVTASQIDILVTPKGKVSTGKTVDQFACKIAAERQFAFIEDNYQSFDMMRGHYQEEIARDIYNDAFDEVDKVGIVTRKLNGFNIGASPDGIVGRDGGIEIKSRIPKFQVQTIVADEVPDEYMNQIQMTLIVTGRKWWDYVQYSNGMPLFVKRVLPDTDRQQKIINALIAFESKGVDFQNQFKAKSVGMVHTKRVEIKFEDDVILASG